MPKQILLFMTVSTLLTSLILPYWHVKAAVPVDVVTFSAGTEYEEGLETFMFDLFTTLQRRQEDFTAAFELQKIEKAREDVNKLIYETQKELVGSGTSAIFDDPLTGAAYIIKRPGRIIHNLDDFLYEEPIQKARDFIYCYFGGDLTDQNNDGVPGPPVIPGETGPFKIFPFGEDDNQSLMLQKDLRDKLLTRIQRKAKYTITAPPQTWYTKTLCDRILASFPITTECFGEVSDKCPTKAAKNYSPTLSKSLSAYKKERGYFTIDEMTQAVLNPNNTYQGTYDYVSSLIENIIGQYAGLRYAEYIAGQGIRAERVFLREKDEATGNWYDFDTDYIISPAIILLQKMQAATQAQFDLAREAYMNIPAFLGDARPEIFEKYNITLSDNFEITSGTGFQDSIERWVRPNVSPPGTLPITEGTLQFRSVLEPSGSTVQGGLPAPWEDESQYMKLPLPTGPNDPLLYDQYSPTDYLYPPPGVPPGELEEPGYIGPFVSGITSIAERPMYRWYKDVLELYEYGLIDGYRLPGMGEKHEGWEKLLGKWFFQEMWNIPPPPL